MVPRRLILVDVAAVPVVVGAYVMFASFDGSDGSPPFTGPMWLGWLVAVCVGAPIAVRRLWPLPAAAIVVLGCAAAAVLDITREPFVPAALVLYTVGAMSTARRSVPALVVALAVLGGALVAGAYVITPSETLAGTIALVGVVWLIAGGGWFLGAATRRRRIAAARAAERDRQSAVAEERLRIAREIHDIVSHNLSVIAVQAGVAGHLAAEQPEQAQAALRSIETTSRGALAEMRGVLGMLRSGPQPDHGDRQPVPGLDELRDLAAVAQASAVTVDLAVDTGRPMPAGVQLAVYRIVQEALTNVIKHAAPARCTVRVADVDGGVTVHVSDDGRRESPRVLGMA